MWSLFFKIPGIISRRTFWLGFVGITIFVIAVNALLRALGTSMAGFWIALMFPFLAIYMIYCVYGKRLRDIGHSLWFLTGMIVLEVLAVIVVMLAFGGAEYFSEFSQYSRKEDIDPAVRDAIITKYQEGLRANNHLIRPILWGIPIVLTLYAGLKASKFQNANEN